MFTVARRARQRAAASFSSIFREIRRRFLKIKFFANFVPDFPEKDNEGRLLSSG
jgi:hypothetical protein